MDLKEAIRKRHSVRQYKDIPIEEGIINELQREIDAINNESGLHFQLILNEPKAFDSTLAHYGNFIGVKNYFALVGKKQESLMKNAVITVKDLCFVLSSWDFIPAG